MKHHGSSGSVILAITAVPPGQALAPAPDEEAGLFEDGEDDLGKSPLVLKLSVSFQRLDLNDRSTFGSRNSTQHRHRL